MAADAPVSCPAIVGATAGSRTGLPLMGVSVDATADMAADGVLVTVSAIGRDVTAGAPPNWKGAGAATGVGEAMGYCMSCTCAFVDCSRAAWWLFWISSARMRM